MAAVRKRTKHRRRRRGSVYLAVVVVLMFAAALFGVSVFFQVEDIKVSGTGAYSGSEIAEISGVEKGDSLLLTQRTAVAAKIKSLPYVDEVRISRSFPGTLIIDVTEVYPAASVQVGGKWWIFDKNAKLLEETDSIGAEDTIAVKGIEPVQPTVGAVMELGEGESVRLSYLKLLLSQILEADIQGDITQLDMSNIGDIKFDYIGRYTVSVGTCDGLENKLELLKGVAGELSDTDTGSIDLSVEGEAHYMPN